MTDILKDPKVVRETTEAQIAVHWGEEELYYPPASFISQANLSDPDVNKRFSEANFPDCFQEYAEMLTWDERWHTTLDTNEPPFWKWFVGGKLNACYNCVDRHLAKYKNKAALICVPEPEDEAPITITYQELYVRVNELVDTFSTEPRLQAYLESLVSRAYSEIHETRAPLRIRWKNLILAFPRAFRRHLGAFSLSLGITLLGCAFGWFVMRQD